MFRVRQVVAVGIAAILVTSCVDPSVRLTAVERRTCVADGGYESRSAFGFPICQKRYADGGKSCLGNPDCEGRCLLGVDGPPERQLPKPGDQARGMCEAQRYTPGCYATIEGGRVSAEGAWCDD